MNIFGKGWSFPLKPTPGGKLIYREGHDKIQQSIWLILATAPGERVMQPAFGCGIHDLVFEPNTATLRGQVQHSVEQALITWEPRIDVLDVRTEIPPEGRNHLLIRIDYRLRSNNAFYNLVYPFFLNEGAGT